MRQIHGSGAHQDGCSASREELPDVRRLGRPTDRNNGQSETIMIHNLDGSTHQLEGWPVNGTTSNSY